MKFELPIASRQRLDELLEYLGNRAEDFKKCFDIDSEWCWKYADLVLRGVDDTRDFIYRERHHVVPASYYGKRNQSIYAGNFIALQYGEHLYAHYCTAQCGRGKMKGKMANAFFLMYKAGKKAKRPIFPNDEEILNSITKLELSRICSMIPRVAQVESDGRVHYWDDPKLANKQSNKKYRDTHAPERAEYNKQYNAEHKEERAAYAHERWFENRDENIEKQCEYRKNNPEKVKASRARWIANNPEKDKEVHRNWAKNNPDKVKNMRKSQYDRKINAGFRYRKDRTTGKYKWIFVGVGAARPKKYATPELEHDARKKQGRDYYHRKIAAGYKNVRNPVTKKLEWIFVGVQSISETIKSGMNAA